MRHARVAMVLAVALSVVLGVTVVRAQGYDVVASFDGTADPPELPEGVSIDPRGEMYVTMGLPSFIGPEPGSVRRVNEDGSTTTLAAFDDGAPAGIVADAEGEVYFARPNPGIEESRGVYRLGADGTAERLPGTEALLIANGLALDGLGGLFASDTATGVIWRIPLDGSAPEPWFSDPSLTGGCGGEGDAGPNGIALQGGDVYVAVTSRGLVVRVPVLDDGTAGEAEVVAGDNTNECEPDGLFGMDGIAFDVDGNIYALLVIQNKLVRIDPKDGSFEVLLDETDGLHNPSSLAFGTMDGDRTSLYLVNYAVLDPVPENSPGPAVLKLDVGVEGAPLP